MINLNPKASKFVVIAPWVLAFIFFVQSLLNPNPPYATITLISLMLLCIWFIISDIMILYGTGTAFHQIFLKADGMQYQNLITKESPAILSDELQNWETELYTLGFQSLGSYQGIHREDKNANYLSRIYLDSAKTAYAVIVSLENGTSTMSFISIYTNNFHLETTFKGELQVNSELISLQNFMNSLTAAYDYHLKEQANFSKKYGKPKTFLSLEDTMSSPQQKQAVHRSLYKALAKRRFVGIAAVLIFALIFFSFSAMIFMSIGTVLTIVITFLIMGILFQFYEYIVTDKLLNVKAVDQGKPRKAAG